MTDDKIIELAKKFGFDVSNVPKIIDFASAIHASALMELEADMLWEVDGHEENASRTANDLAETSSYDMQYKDESIIRVQCAYSLPDRYMHIKFESGDLVWEWVDKQQYVSVHK